MDEVFAAQRAAFAREMNPSLDVRRDRLDRLLRLTETHQERDHRCDLGGLRPSLAAGDRSRRHLHRALGNPAYAATSAAMDESAARSDAAAFAARVERADSPAAGSGRRHQPVELSLPACDAARCRGARGRQSRDAEAERAHAAVFGAPAEDRRGILRARRIRGASRRRRIRARVLAAALRSSVLHRIDRGRTRRSRSPRRRT